MNKTYSPHKTSSSSNNPVLFRTATGFPYLSKQHSDRPNNLELQA